MSVAVSVVLPAYRAADQLREVVPEMLVALADLPVEPELLVVLNGPDDGGAAVAAELHARDPRIRVLECERAGWGHAVRTGLAAATGDLLAYTNLARTPPVLLRDAITLALASPGAVVKATRTTRDRLVRRIGSVLYNLECRALLRVAVFDVNGTPKVFPATLEELRDLRRDDDLIDAELVAICTARGYRVVELSAPVLPRHSGPSTTGLRSAWRMYSGVLGLRRELARRGIAPPDGG